MVVDLNNRDAVRAFVREQASLGRDHVIRLIRADRDAMLGMISDLSEEEASYRPSVDEYSVTEVLQHLNSSFARSIERLSALSSGKPWLNTSMPAQGPGGILPGLPTCWDEVRRYFVDGEDGVLALLSTADGTTGLDLTANHAAYGTFNWLEWAVYSHHAHTSDHIAQVRRLRDDNERRRQAAKPSP